MLSTIEFKNFGQQIKKIRKSIKLTQKKVSEMSGINEDTLRRIENGLVIPKYETLELLSNIYKLDLIKILLDYKSDVSICNIYKLFDTYLITEDKNKILYLNKINLQINEANTNNLIDLKEFRLVKEFIKISISIISNTHLDYIDCIEQLEKSLKYTIDEFNLTFFKSYKYSELELRILLVVGLIYKQMNELKKAIDIFDFCLHYLTLTQSNYEITNIQLKIKLYYNLSYAYYKIEDDKNSLKAASLGIKLCHEHKLHYCLEMLLARKAVAELYLKDENYMNTFKDALYLLYALGEHQQIEYLVSKTKEKHGIDLSSITTAFY